MASDYLERPEVIGKTIKNLRLYVTDTATTEIMIQFEDGTAFTSSEEMYSCQSKFG